MVEEPRRGGFGGLSRWTSGMERSYYAYYKRGTGSDDFFFPIHTFPPLSLKTHQDSKSFTVRLYT